MVNERAAFLLLLAGFLFVSCAQVVSPEGGPRDSKGPVLQFTIPARGTSGVKAGEKIKMEFDEYIQIKDAAGQWIISPPMNGLPNYVVRGKQLSISLPDSLRPNATYVIQFGNSVADIHEGTVTSGLSVVFSTGSAVDSGRVQGQLLNARGSNAGKGFSVFLYKQSRSSLDSLLYKHAPDYYAPANDAGSFLIDFLPRDTFRIFAVKDLNKNFRYDPPDEEVGFFPTYVLPNDSLKTNLVCFKEEPPCFVSKQSNPFWGHYTVSLSAPDSLLVLPLPGNDCSWRQEMNQRKDTLHLWLKHEKKDSAYFVLSGKKLNTDTLAFFLMPEKSFKGAGRASKSGTKEKAVLKTSDGTSMLRPGDVLKLVFPTPVDTLYKDSLRVTCGKRSIPYTWERTALRTIEMKADWRSDSLYVLDGAVGFARDFLGRALDSLDARFEVLGKDALGSLTLFLEDSDSARICVYKLFGPSSPAFSEIRGHAKTLVYENLVPGTYHLEVREDKNNNGQFDSGNLLDNRLPERVYISRDIQVRANWDLEETIEVELK